MPCLWCVRRGGVGTGLYLQVYDVVFSPKTLQLAEADKQLRKMVIDTALDGITQRFPIHKLARDNLKFPTLKFKVSAVSPTRPIHPTRPPARWYLNCDPPRYASFIRPNMH